MFRKYLSREGINFRGSFDSPARESSDLSCADLEEISRRAVLNAAKLALEKQHDIPETVTISDHDILRAIDQWKLMRSL